MRCTQRRRAMKAWLQRFMSGRYGQDSLNQFLLIFSVILCLIAALTQWVILNAVAMAILLLTIFRMFSRNSVKRAQENLAFFHVKQKIVAYFKGIQTRLRKRKTHRFFTCPSCKQALCVPKGKGNITIHCPKCHTSIKKKT